jgi:hypothetical protein
MNWMLDYLPPLVLCACSAVLMAWHLRVWRGVQQDVPESRERDFRRRQFRRRMQTSAMLGALGAAIIVGQLLMSIESKTFLVVYWGGVLALALWMALLAIADMVATGFHYRRDARDQLIERARLQAELLHAQKAAAQAKNGKPGSNHAS